MSNRPFNVRVWASGPLGGYLQAPPSKNYTTRLILLAALAEGPTVVRNPARNDDALALAACCRAMGAKIEEREDGYLIEGVAGRPNNPGRLNPANAGAVLRLLLGTACLIDGGLEFYTTFTDSLGRRPNAELLVALRQFGVLAEGTGAEGMLPIRIAGGDGVRGSRVTVSGARSSQFLSSLLFLAPLLPGDSVIEVREPGSSEPGPLVSQPLIHQTLDALARFGVEVEADFENLSFKVPGGQIPRAEDVTVNGDWPSTAALLAATAVGGGMITLHGLFDDAQGERRAADALVEMGCRFEAVEGGARRFHSRGELKAIRFNGDLATDAVLALAGAACLAEGTSRFEGVANLRLKECDRIREPLEELTKIGVDSRFGDDWIEIDGKPEGYKGGVRVDSRGDHRVAQMLAIVGLRCEKGLTILRAEHISKSYPGFFQDLDRLGVHLAIEKA